MEQNAERQSEADVLRDAAVTSGTEYENPGRGKIAVCRNGQKVYSDTFDANSSLISLFVALSATITNQNTRKDAEKFVSSFRAFDAGRGIRPEAVNGSLINSFREFLAGRGHTASYIAKRLQNFRSMYRRLEKEGRVPQSAPGCFDIVSSAHPSGNPSARKTNCKEGVLPALGRLARMRINDSALAAARDRLIRSILSGGSGEAAETHRGGLIPEYQLLLRSSGLDAESFGASMATELWIRAARECGIPASAIAAVCPNVPEGFAEHSVDGRAAETDRDKVLGKVADTILGNDPAWYAVRIRQGNDSETVRGLLAADPRLADIRPFTPVERLMVRHGKRLKATIVERIRRVMFLEAEPALIADAAKAIAPAASVYRQSRAANAPFARIPRREMDNFRILLGAATADDLDLVDTSDLTHLPEGTPVEVTDGPFAGYRGLIHSRGTRCLLTVALTSDFGLRVTATIPAPYLRDINNY